LGSARKESWPSAPPSIVQQSAGSTNVPGETASFSVQAIGAAPLAYQWSKNGQPISPQANPGATSAALTLTNIQFVDAGAYRVVVTNGVGTVTSSIIILAVIAYNRVTNGLALALDFDLTGTPVPIVTGYTFNGSVLPAADYDYTFGALLTSSSAGQLQIQGVRHGGTSYGVFVNALQLVANPVLRISAAKATGTGNLQLTVQTQYPGQPLTFEQTTALAPATWVPATNAVITQVHGTTLSVQFPLAAGRKFYRAAGR
jgi:hypothetical protein